MARDPDELDTDDLYDEEAVIDEEAAAHPLADSPGLGMDLPEADTLDQWREVDLDDDQEGREPG
jgi:hypothetical protein